MTFLNWLLAQPGFGGNSSEWYDVRRAWTKKKITLVGRAGLLRRQNFLGELKKQQRKISIHPFQLWWMIQTLKHPNVSISRMNIQQHNPSNKGIKCDRKSKWQLKVLLQNILLFNRCKIRVQSWSSCYTSSVWITGFVHGTKKVRNDHGFSSLIWHLWHAPQGCKSLDLKRDAKLLVEFAGFIQPAYIMRNSEAT